MAVFEIIEFCLPDTCAVMLDRMQESWRIGNPRQSGMSLMNQSWLDTCFPRQMRGLHLRLDRSSYRVQRPNGHGALALHQDTEALMGDCGLTVWLPLVPLDEFTPSLEVCPWSANAIAHKRDAANYSVIAEPTNFDDWPLLTVTHLALGQAILFGPRLLHRTCVRPWHTKVRHSLDLRFLPSIPGALRKEAAAA